MYDVTYSNLLCQSAYCSPAVGLPINACIYNGWQVVFVHLDNGERKSVTSELAEYDFSAIQSKAYGESNSRFDGGCTFLTPEFLSKRIMTAVDTLAADMAIEIEAVIMQGNNINIAAPELDTLLHLRAEIDRAKELGDLFSSRKKISLKKLRVSADVRIRSGYLILSYLYECDKGLVGQCGYR